LLPGGRGRVAFSQVNIHAPAKIACTLAHVNGNIASLVTSSTTSLRNHMNRTTHIRPTSAMGFIAQGRGPSCAAGMAGFELTMSAQAGVEATQ